jgi:cytochrome c553
VESARSALAARAVGLVAALLLGWLLAGSARAQDGAGDGDLIKRAVHVCAACHGEGGRSTNAAFPHLAGQQPLYFIAQLRAFRDQKRSELDSQAYMWGVSALLDDHAIKGLAEHYAAQPAAKGVRKGQMTNQPAREAAGRRIFFDGIAARGVRACASCHGDRAEGEAAFPRLAGQHADYLQRQLALFGTKLRPHGVMKGEAAVLTPAERRAVAEFIQSLD